MTDQTTTVGMLQQLTSAGESSTLEFKKSTAEKERACRTLCAFANATGGVAYEKVLNTTRVMPRANYQRLLMESMHATQRWETLPAQGCEVDSLDTREIVLTLEESIRRGRRKTLEREIPSNC